MPDRPGPPPQAYSGGIGSGINAARLRRARATGYAGRAPVPHDRDEVVVRAAGRARHPPPDPAVTLHRQLLREIAVPMALALALVCELLAVMQVLQMNGVLFGAGSDAAGVLRITALLLPHFAVTALPLSFLLALLLGIGRLAEDNELLALSALGRSPNARYLVPLLMSAVLAAAMHPIVAIAEPRGLHAIHRLLNALVKRNVAGNIQPGVLNEEITDLTVYVGTREGPAGTPRWRNVLVRDGRGNDPYLVLARRGRADIGGAEDSLQVDMQDGELHRTDPSGAYTRARFESASLALGIVSFLRRSQNFIGPTEEMTSDELARARADAERAGDRSAARLVELRRHSRRAAVFVCPAFALLGVPLAAGRRTTRARSYAATLAAFAGYHVVLVFARGLGEAQRVPPIVAAWAPIAAALLVAAVLYVRLRRSPPPDGSMR